MDMKGAVCLLLSLLSVSRAQDVDRCQLAACLQPLRCGQLEQCLLVALKDGCNSELIAYSAFDAYKSCLFGPEGFCTLRPLTACYNRYLLPHMGIPLPTSTQLDPVSLAGFIGVLLEDASDRQTGSQPCSDLVRDAKSMEECVLMSVNQGQRYCDTAMPVLSNKYFAAQNLKRAFETSRTELLYSLTSFVERNGPVGKWTPWMNTFQPTSSNASDYEPTVTCDGGAWPVSADCSVVESSSQLCLQADCRQTQNVLCVTRGLTCQQGQQPRNTQGQCPCCDYRVRYCCPIQELVTIYPTYGPVSGGTNVTIVGGAIPRTGVDIEFDNMPCPLQAISPQRVICKVPALRGGLGAFAQKTVSVYLVGLRSRQNLNVTYTYRKQAEVTTVYGLKTVVSGGTNVTVEGKFLMSLSQASMTIKVNYNNNNQLQTWDFRATCWVVSDSMMRCPVPALLDPVQFTPNASRPIFNSNISRPNFNANLAPATPAPTNTQGFILQLQEEAQEDEEIPAPAVEDHIVEIDSEGVRRRRAAPANGDWIGESDGNVGTGNNGNNDRPIEEGDTASQSIFGDNYTGVRRRRSVPANESTGKDGDDDKGGPILAEDIRRRRSVPANKSTWEDGNDNKGGPILAEDFRRRRSVPANESTREDGNDNKGGPILAEDFRRRRSVPANESTWEDGNDNKGGPILAEDFRRRRSVLHLTGRHPARRRHKRAACDSQGGTPINVPNELWYEVTFDLDGQSVNGGNMDVYADPDIQIFAESPGCRALPTWRLGETITLDIRGSRLNTGLGCAEYAVRVGVGQCHMEDLFSNQIVCSPPEGEPQPAPGEPADQLGVEVRIGNGNLRFSVGCVQYEGFLDHDPALYGLITGLCAAVLLLIIIAICCCRYCRKKRSFKKA